MPISDDTTTPTALARELGTEPWRVRGWLRANGIRSEVERWQRWSLSPAQADHVRLHFGETGEAAAPTPESEPAFEGASWTVGQLLGTYASILAELRLRGLVRTNNAPIGDLAEYACAIVYDGTLAPNSEKAFDLMAADGRRIQVKVRNIRADTSPSATFSVIRSFGFDACIFVLIDVENDRVQGAFEWTADDVQEHGVHRTHTNGIAIRVSQARRHGTDLTDQVDEAWREMLQSV
jgi:hypothetical protein